MLEVSICWLNTDQYEKPIYFYSREMLTGDKKFLLVSDRGIDEINKAVNELDGKEVLERIKEVLLINEAYVVDKSKVGYQISPYGKFKPEVLKETKVKLKYK